MPGARRERTGTEALARGSNNPVLHLRPRQRAPQSRLAGKKECNAIGAHRSKDITSHLDADLIGDVGAHSRSGRADTYRTGGKGVAARQSYTAGRGCFVRTIADRGCRAVRGARQGPPRRSPQRRHKLHSSVRVRTFAPSTAFTVLRSVFLCSAPRASVMMPVADQSGSSRVSLRMTRLIFHRDPS